MKLRKSEMFALGIIIAAFFYLPTWTGEAEGQERPYPKKTIEVIINYTPGGPVDTATRIITDELTKELGVPISIQYKPGAGGLIGGSAVAVSKPDGYTLLSTTASPITLAPLTEKEPPYKYSDFTPIALYALFPNLLAANSSSKLTSFDAMLRLAKEKPGMLNCATPGVATTPHYVIEILKMHGINLTHVPAKGAAPAVTNLLGNHVDLVILFYAPLLPHVRSGAIRLLAATSKLKQDPGVPTLAEKGIPETEALTSWQGFLAPANLPNPILDQLSSSLRKVLQMPSVITALEKAGFALEYMGPNEFKERIAKDSSIMEKVVKTMGALK